jgi:low temperature requirement protein LtrA
MSEHHSPNNRGLVIPMLPRSPDEKHRSATTLELFFDLVFVVAVAQVSAALHHGIAEAHFAEAISSYALAFFGITWAWVNFTWFASAYDVDDVPYRLMVFVQLTGAIIFAAGIPSFMEGDRTTVILGYVVMRLAMVVQWLRAARSDPARRRTAYTYALGISIVQGLWVLSLFVNVWEGAILLLLIFGELLVPTLAERLEPTTWHPHHIAERYGLFTIIVLGEFVLSLSVGIRSALEAGEFSPILVGIIAGGLLILFSMWWLYFDWPMPHMLTSLRRVFVWAYAHYFVFAAAVGAGLAVEVDFATHHAEISTRAAGAAVAIPVAVYLFVLWVLFGLDKANRNFQYFVLPPLAIVVILLTPFWGAQTAIWTGLVMVAFLAYKLLSPRI